MITYHEIFNLQTELYEQYLYNNNNLSVSIYQLLTLVFIRINEKLINSKLFFPTLCNAIRYAYKKLILRKSYNIIYTIRYNYIV